LSPELAARHGSMPGMFRRLLAAVDEGLEFQDYACTDGELPATTEASDAYLVTGSPHGVYDGLPWMTSLQDFCRAADAAGRKVIGVCFGHQLLADAYGGTVEKSAQGWGVGLHRYEVAAREAWMAPPLAAFANIVFHQDQVTVPPPGARLLASSAFCRHAMLQIGDNILTLQSHPELTKAFATELLEGRREMIGHATAETALESLQAGDDSHLVARWMLRFLDA
jgi:GMP synthase-like glutamine amidotransferase